MRYNLSLDEDVSLALEKASIEATKKLGIEVSPLELIRKCVNEKYKTIKLPENTFVQVFPKNKITMFVESGAFYILFAVKDLGINILGDRIVDIESCLHVDKNVFEDLEDWTHKDIIEGFNRLTIDSKNRFSLFKISFDKFLLCISSWKNGATNDNINHFTLTIKENKFLEVDKKFIDFFFDLENGGA